MLCLSFNSAQLYCMLFLISAQTALFYLLLLILLNVDPALLFLWVYFPFRSICWQYSKTAPALCTPRTLFINSLDLLMTFNNCTSTNFFFLFTLSAQYTIAHPSESIWMFWISLFVHICSTAPSDNSKFSLSTAQFKMIRSYFSYQLISFYI